MYRIYYVIFRFQTSSVFQTFIETHTHTVIWRQLTQKSEGHNVRGIKGCVREKIQKMRRKSIISWPGGMHNGPVTRLLSWVYTWVRSEHYMLHV